MKVFFSHANEDKPIVEQVFLRVNQKFPTISGWLDKYEIKGGDELIDKISEGIDSSDKFLIFLSSSSIEKPWVKAELRKALMKEITGVNPEFIIPIKLGKISSFPPFLESKLYIDLESKTEDEWLSDMYTAITRQPKLLEHAEENLVISIHIASDNPKAVVVAFESRFWAEDIGFKVITKKKIKKRLWRIPHLKGIHQLSITQLATDMEYGIKLDNQRIERSKLFFLGMEFESTEDPRKEIDKVEKWDGTGGNSSFSITNFT